MLAVTDLLGQSSINIFKLCILRIFVILKGEIHNKATHYFITFLLLSSVKVREQCKKGVSNSLVALQRWGRTFFL